MWVFIGFAILLTVVTLIGHGIWVLLASVFGSARPQPSTPRSTSKHCPRCEARIWSSKCPVCHWPEPGRVKSNSTATALAETRRRLTHFHELGLLDDAAFRRLDQSLDKELQLLKREHERVESVALEAVEELPTLDLADDEPIAEPMVVAAPTASPEERVRQFVERQAHRPASAEFVPKPEPPTPPRKPWTDLLAAFMEEKNIRWGELVGGLLIVGCSIALVISFWAKIAERPFLKFFVFNGVTAALFGLGLYSEKRWKLRTTSDGLLITAALLVPLNFLAIAAFTQGAVGINVLMIFGELFSIALFGALLYSAGQCVVPGTAVPLVIGVMAPSILQLLIRRFINLDGERVPAELFGLVIVIVLGAVNGFAMWTVRRRESTDETRSATAFKLLGITMFAALLAVGLLMFKLGDLTSAFNRLSPVVCLIGLTPLVVGVDIWRRLGATAAALRTAALSVAVAGGMMMAASIVLAWPSPLMVLVCASIAAVTLIAAGIRFELPQAYLLAAPCVIAMHLLACHVIAGKLPLRTSDAAIVRDALISGRSGLLLVPLVVGLGLIAVGLNRIRRRADASHVTISAIATAALSVVLITRFGFGVDGDPLHATWIYALYGIAAYLLALRTTSVRGLCASAGLILLAVLQGIVFDLATRTNLPLPWVFALTVHAAILLVVAVATHFAGNLLRREVFGPMLQVGSVAVSTFAVGLLCGKILLGDCSASLASSALLAIGGIWLTVSLLRKSPVLFTAFQVALTGAVWFFVAARLETHAWFRDAAWPWLDPWAMIAEAVALVALSLAWIVIRLILRGRDDRLKPYRALLYPSWLSVDAIVVRIALVVLVGLATYAALPGVAQELSPRLSAPSAARIVPPLSQFELPHMPHDHARGWGIRLLMATLVITLIAETWTRKADWNRLWLLLVASLACPLLASHWQAEVATASALRWLSTGFLLAASIVIWLREPLAKLLARNRREEVAVEPLDRDVRFETAAVFWLSFIPLVAMGLYVGVAATWRQPPPSDLRWWFLPLGAMFVTAAFISLALRPMTRNAWASHASVLLLVLGIAPLLSVTLYVVAAALKQSPVLGPEPTSWFAQVGLAVSYAVPVLITAATLVGYAVRERSASFAFAGGLVLNLGVTAGYLLSIAKSGLQFDAALWVRLAQLNAIVAAAFAIAWMLAVYLRNRKRYEAPVNELLITQVAIPISLNFLVLAPTWFAIVINPRLTFELAPIADSWGISALVLTLAAAIGLAWVLRPSSEREASPTQPLIQPNWLLFATFIVGTLAASYVGNATLLPWSALHILLAFHVASVVGLAVGGPLLDDNTVESRCNISRYAIVAATIATILALRAMFGDPQAPWWTVGSLLTVAASIVWTSCRSLRRGLLYFSAVLINLAASTWWIGSGWKWFGLGSPEVIFFYVNVIALALPAVLWTFIELRVFQPAGNLATRAIPVHRLAARSCVAMMTLLVVDSLAIYRLPIEGAWLAVAATAIAAGACLWDARARDAVALLYITGLLAAGVLLDSLNLTPHWLLWLGTITLSAYGVATSFLWSRRQGLREFADVLRIPRGEDAPFAGLTWLVPANCVLAVVVIGMTFYIELTYAELSLRVMAAKAVLAQVLAIGLLARGERRSQLQYTSLAIGVLAAVALGWSALEPGNDGGVLNRGVVVTAALAAVTVLYALGLTKLLRAGNEWLLAAQRMVPGLIVTSALSLAFVLGTEIVLAATTGKVIMATWAIAVVAATLVGLVAAALAAAVLPGRDPLGLSERGRQLYVYGAEIVLALLFVHIRLTMPWLFHGFFQRYWPLVIMLIAFIGAGMGEWFRRRKQTVLGDPLENTGAILPLLPVLGYWMLPARVDYSLLLVTVGMLYAGLSVARKSFGFGVLAAVAANGGLWYFLNRWEGYRLIEHPQLWLIPPALCVLAAAHINRKQLSDAQMTAIRYGTMVMVYVSSTADIFLNGVAEAPWLPLVLAAFSLVGIFAGIWMRVRAFLFLGTAFLILSILTIIWHAAVDLHHTWLIWAAGIVTGVLIIAVFAVFEKKRDTVLGVVEQLKHWQP